MINEMNEDDNQIEVASKKSSVKRVTPLGRDLEDALKDAKDEMKEYIDELLSKSA